MWDGSGANNDLIAIVKLFWMFYIIFFTATKDFIAEEKDVIFSGSANKSCTIFNIIDDFKVEEEKESFEVSFGVPADVIPPCNNSVVTIIDDDSEYTITNVFNSIYHSVI